MSDDLGNIPQEIDADAVCAQCGTVNREGVFICRTCGNNLRDQRALRMIAEQEMDRKGEPLDRRRFFLGALTTFGILLILWAALNVNTITDWLIEIQTPSLGAAEALWQDTALNDLAAELDGRKDTADDLEKAIANPAVGDTIEGVYALAREGLGGKRALGTVIIRPQDGRVLFVAKLEDGAEVRGYGDVRENQIVADADSAGAQYGGRAFSVFGVAVPKADGTYECAGQTEIDNEMHTAYVYRLAQ